MPEIALGLGVLVALMWASRAFSRADVASIKSLLSWIAALAGLSLVAMLLLTGRGGAALGGLVMFGPLIWDRCKHYLGQQPRVAGQRPNFGNAAPIRPGPMTRAEALDVLGLRDPVSETDIRAAWKRLMRVAHPDGGGSDWLAARVNQAKDVLLGRR
jgi:hypothetical protein